MYYYSLEKYYKRNDLTTLTSPTESLRKAFTPSDLPTNETELHIARSRKEKSAVSSGLNRELFKRIRAINSDFSEALETVFSYQFSLNGFTVEIVKAFEKLAQTVGNITKPENNTTRQKQTKPSSVPSSPSAKLTKTPLEIEISAIVFNVQKLQEELFSLVTDVIPKKEKSLSKAKPSRASNAPSNECSPLNKRPSVSNFPIVVENRGLNRSQLSSQKSPKMQSSKSKMNLQRIYEQDQKENQEISQVMHVSQSSRILSSLNTTALSQLKVSVNKNFPNSTRNSVDARILNKRAINLSNTPSESISNILSDLKNESKRNISDKFSGKLESDVIPKKELEEDETNTLMTSMPTSEALPTLGNQKSQSGNMFSRIFATKVRDDHIEIIKKEKNLIKHLLSVQNNPIINASKTIHQTPLCQKRYLIDAKWWTSWKEYVNFDSNAVDESKCITQVYPRPRMIMNQDLINQDDIKQSHDESSGIGLKEHLLEHHDFEAVSKEVFEALAAWYGCDYEVIRLLRPDPSHPDKFFLDLFPKRRIKKPLQQKSLPENILMK